MLSSSNKLLKDVRACTICVQVKDSVGPVLQIQPEATILIASQAPGPKAHATGVPFVDTSK